MACENCRHVKLISSLYVVSTCSIAEKPVVCHTLTEECKAPSRAQLSSSSDDPYFEAKEARRHHLSLSGRFRYPKPSITVLRMWGTHGLHP